MTYLLDTNACIALVRGKPRIVRTRFEESASRGARLAISPIVTFELWTGVHKSERVEASTERLGVFLSGPVELVEFREDDSREAGRIRALLEANGTGIGAYDVLIAGQALRLGAIVVTTNVGEFARVPGLRWENWEAGTTG